MEHNSKYIHWFEDIGIEDVTMVGGKNASLGGIYRELAGREVKIPNGFAITSEAYRIFMRIIKDFIAKSRAARSLSA